MRFKFTAIKENGQRFEGVLESQNKFTLYNELKAEGQVLISAEEVKKNRLKTLFFKIFSFLGDISTINKINFAKNLGAMTKAGLSLNRALSIIGSQSTNEKFKNVVEEINLEIRKGGTLSGALKNYPNIFSDLFISMAKAGEESGSLSLALTNVGLQMEKTYRLQKKIKGAMIYPAVIFSVMIAVGIILFTYVIPGIVLTFKELKTELPLSTKFIIFISDFMTGHWFILLIILFVILATSYFSFKIPTVKKMWNGTLIKLPVIGDLMIEANAARVTRTLSSLLSSGVPVAQSIQITKGMVDNYYFREVLEEVIRAVEKGENMSKIFMKNTELYPAFIGEMIGVGEETGNISQMLQEVAIYYETDVEDRTKDLSTIIEPVLMVIIGIAVGFFALSMITPIYSVMDNV